MKYYITSGDLKVVIDRPNMLDAVCGALEAHLDSRGVAGLGALIRVSERGFDGNDEDRHLHTVAMLEKFGYDYDIDESP